MTDDSNPAPKPPARDNHGIGLAGTSIIVFILGVVVGIPVANFGAEVLVRYAGEVFAILFGIFLVVLLVGALVALFRRQIWGSIFKRAEIEMDRFARPLADVARFAAEQNVDEATDAARNLAELVLARYAWVSTRRWLLGTLTGLIAAIAALAGSALLFQQNQLLRVQNTLIQGQTERLDAQNKLLGAQIELGEAQRSTSIVPEILEIGSLLGGEVQNLVGDRHSVLELSPALRARIVAASNAARPYRHLRTPLNDLDERLIMNSGLLRRTDLAASAAVQKQITDSAGAPVVLSGEQNGVMADRPVSPERGQLIMTLAALGINDIGALRFSDFSFAEVRTSSLSGMSFEAAMMRFADFDRQTIIASGFDAASLEHARFRGARISHCSFVSIVESLLNITRPTELSGTDFSGAILQTTRFTGTRGLGVNFDGAVVHDVDFGKADLSGGTFRNAIFGKVDFTAASLKSVDFDGAIVFDPAFLDTVAKQAVPETFAADRFSIVPIEQAEFAGHPRWADAWLDGLQDGQAYRVRRVKEFDA